MVLTGLQRREKAGAQILTSPRVLGMYFCPHSSWVCLLWLLGIEGLTISIWCTGLLKLWLQFSPEMHGDVCGIWFRSDIISVSALPDCPIGLVWLWYILVIAEWLNSWMGSRFCSPKMRGGTHFTTCQHIEEIFWLFLLLALDNTVSFIRLKKKHFQ